jgi:hypothetical protein
VEDYLDEIVGNIQRFYLERMVKVPIRGLKRPELMKGQAIRHLGVKQVISV